MMNARKLEAVHTHTHTHRYNLKDINLRLKQVLLII